ncbi:MAG: hypothetical protein ACOH2N_00540 [Devosia sp.]
MTEPLLMYPGEAMQMKEVGRRLKIPTETLRNWFRKYGIGNRTLDGGRIYMSIVAALMIQHDDGEALAAYLDGDRKSSRVLKYFDHLGISTRGVG